MKYEVNTISLEAMSGLAQNAVGKPVYDNLEDKNIIGSVTDVRVEDGCLSIGAVLDRLPEGLGEMYIVPVVSVESGDIEESGGVRIINGGNLLSCTLTRYPVKEGMPPIQIE